MDNEEQKERRRDSHTWTSVLAQVLLKLCGQPANIAAKWVPLAFMVAALAQPVSDAVIALAGNNTMADFRVSALADIKLQSEYKQNAAGDESDTQKYLVLATALAITFGIAGLLAAQRQRRLRLDVIEKMSKRIEFLEKMVDPNRSTSGLTVRGETNPEDL